MKAKVIESCVYDNEFRKVDDVVEGAQEDLQAHIDFGYVEVIGNPETGAADTEIGAKEPEEEVVEPEPAKAKPKPSKSRNKK